MHYSEQELSKIKSITDDLKYNPEIFFEERETLESFVRDAVVLVNKVQELKAYLQLPKFQGVETIDNECPDCGVKSTRIMGKEWVSVQDIFNRL